MPTDWAVVLFIVPVPVNPVPVPVQVTLLIAIVPPVAVKSPPARWVKVAVDAVPVLTFAVTETALSAATDGLVSGSASEKLMVLGDTVNFALALIAMFTVRFWFCEAPKADVEIATNPKMQRNKTHFFIFFFLFLIRQSDR
jgi:hypothetical protein